MAAKRKSKYKKTQREYAEFFNRDERTIREWQKKKYPLDDPDAMEIKLAEQLHQGGKDAESDGERIDAATLTDEQLENPGDAYEAKLYEAILRCRKLAHALRESKRQVIPLDEVKAGQLRVCAAVKTALLALPGELPTKLAGKVEHEIQPIVFDSVYRILTALSDGQNALYA